MSKIAIPSRATYKVRNPATEESLFIGSNRAIINAHQMHHALKRMQNRSHQASSHYKVKGLGSPFKTSHQQEIWLETIRLFANFGAHSAQLQNSLRKFYIKC